MNMVRKGSWWVAASHWPLAGLVIKDGGFGVMAIGREQRDQQYTGFFNQSKHIYTENPSLIHVHKNRSSDFEQHLSNYEIFAVDTKQYYTIIYTIPNEI